MVTDLFHRFLYPTLAATIVGTIWVVGSCQALIAEADKHSWPAISVPGHTSEVSASELSTGQDGGGSLHKILLKYDQVIRVR